MEVGTKKNSTAFHSESEKGMAARRERAQPSTGNDSNGKCKISLQPLNAARNRIGLLRPLPRIDQTEQPSNSKLLAQNDTVRLRYSPLNASLDHCTEHSRLCMAASGT